MGDTTPPDIAEVPTGETEPTDPTTDGEVEPTDEAIPPDALTAQKSSAGTSKATLHTAQGLVNILRQEVLPRL